MGAGILPTTIYNGKLYFLLGKENKYADSPGWSDFGGGTDNNESFTETAMREGSEELTGFLGDKQDIKKLLSKGTFIIQNDDRYRMFLVALQYDSQLPFYYNNNYRFLDKKLDETLLKTSKIFEKSEIKWVCIDYLIKMKNKFRSFFKKKIYILLSKKREIYNFVKKKLYITRRRFPENNNKKTRKKSKTRKNN
jgi:hypothetical protein